MKLSTTITIHRNDREVLVGVSAEVEGTPEEWVVGPVECWDWQLNKAEAQRAGDELADLAEVHARAKACPDSCDLCATVEEAIHA